MFAICKQLWRSGCLDGLEAQEGRLLTSYHRANESTPLLVEIHDSRLLIRSCAPCFARRCAVLTSRTPFPTPEFIADGPEGRACHHDPVLQRRGDGARSAEGVLDFSEGVLGRQQNPGAALHFWSCGLWPAVYARFRLQAKELVVLARGTVSRREGTLNFVMDGLTAIPADARG